MPYVLLRTLSRARYLLMRNAIVAASVALNETMTVPIRGPKIAPAVMVRGMAGKARTCFGRKWKVTVVRFVDL